MRTDGTFSSPVLAPMMDIVSDAQSRRRRRTPSRPLSEPPLSEPPTEEEVIGDVDTDRGAERGILLRAAEGEHGVRALERDILRTMIQLYNAVDHLHRMLVVEDRLHLLERDNIVNVDTDEHHDVPSPSRARSRSPRSQPSAGQRGACD